MLAHLKIIAYHWVLTKIKSFFNLAHLASSSQVCSVLTISGGEEKSEAKSKDENAKVLPKIPNYAAETFVCLLRSWPRWTEQQQEEEFEICRENIIHIWSAKKVNRTIRWSGCWSFSVKNIRTFGWHLKKWHKKQSKFLRQKMALSVGWFRKFPLCLDSSLLAFHWFCKDWLENRI